MKTFIVKKNNIIPKWYIIDVKEKILGRIATKIATLLLCKNKVEYTPHLNISDYFVILNAAKIIVTGNKIKNKFYYRHSNYPGGIKKINYQQLINTYPERILLIAIKGMLPKNKLSNLILNKLKIFAGSKHNHIAQNPKILNI